MILSAVQTELTDSTVLGSFSLLRSPHSITLILLSSEEGTSELRLERTLHMVFGAMVRRESCSQPLSLRINLGVRVPGTSSPYFTHGIPGLILLSLTRIHFPVLRSRSPT